MSRLKNDVKPSVSWPPSRHVKPPDDIPRGILLMIAATVLFAVWSAIGKWQVAIYPVGEVMFLRSISSFIVCMAVVLPFTGMSVFAMQRRRDHIARGLSQAVSQTFTIIAFGLMPLAGAIAINFSAPLWATLLSIVWLKERAGPARWTALLCGFFGVLIVANPGVLAHARRAVRVGQCRDVRQRHGCGAWYDENRADEHATDVADGHSRNSSCSAFDGPLPPMRPC